MVRVDARERSKKVRFKGGCAARMISFLRGYAGMCGFDCFALTEILKSDVIFLN